MSLEILRVSNLSPEKILEQFFLILFSGLMTVTTLSFHPLNPPGGRTQEGFLFTPDDAFEGLLHFKKFWLADELEAEEMKLFFSDAEGLLIWDEDRAGNFGKMLSEFFFEQIMIQAI